jgi:hypothetical protein
MEGDMDDDVVQLRDRLFRNHHGDWPVLIQLSEKLPEPLRETFDLLLQEGLSRSEAAARLGVDAKTVGRRWRKAILALREELVDVDHPDEKWEALNKRRVELIEKEADAGLSEEELSELEAIQKEIGRYLNIIAPLPFEVLEQFEERARRAGIRLDDEEARRP